jgi:hypothetical protein
MVAVLITLEEKTKHGIEEKGISKLTVIEYLLYVDPMLEI